MRKKMKLFIAMVSVGALLGTMPVMAAEQPELPTKIWKRSWNLLIRVFQVLVLRISRPVFYAI